MRQTRPDPRPRGRAAPSARLARPVAAVGLLAAGLPALLAYDGVDADEAPSSVPA
ncbi:hypothetical protein [Streptomyces sp.]|uniref:hypothetical protein n=1 Tax=Streptomyces sp. TaxID=1931 RepID=UPI002F41E89E